MNAPGRRLRRASAADLPGIEALLKAAELPVEGIANLPEGGLIVSEAPDGLLGCAALEVHGRHGLLRSVAVREDRRGHGVGDALVLDRLHHGRELGLTSIYLLTITAAGWFPRFGFQPVERADVPEEIRRSWEFSVHCPSSAAVLAISLESPVAFVLVRPRLPGNLGMVCRAATAFGFPDVRIVSPVLDVANPQARWFAHGAERTLSRVRKFDSLDEALEDCRRCIATTARRRHWNRPMHEPAELVDLFREASVGRRLAVVFGPEDHGLSNDEIARCDTLLSVPRPPAMGATLSLPACAAIVAWEIAKARGIRLGPPPGRKVAVARGKRPLTNAELGGFIESIASTLEGLGLRTQPDAARFRGTLRDFFSRARPTEGDHVFLRHLFAQLGKWKRRVLQEARREAAGETREHETR